MTRVEKNCLKASLAAHGLLLAILLLAPAFSRREASAPMAPVLEILPNGLKLTMDGTVRGGNPQPLPTKPAQPVATQPANPPAPKPEASKPDVAPRVNVAPEPVRSAPKPQEQEAGKKPEKKPDVEQLAANEKGGKPGIKVSPTKVVPNAAEKKKMGAADKDADAAADRERFRRGAAQVAKLLGQSKDNLKAELSPNTEITMPGPGGGGAVYADYFAYLQAFYQAQWNRRKPSNVSVNLALVKARITIARDGTVTAHTIYEPSGIRAVDDSVRRVLNENKKLEPLPADAPGAEITVTITFKVEGDTSA